MDEARYDLPSARNTFSRIGLAFCAILAISTVLQIAWVMIPELIWGEENWATSSSWGIWIGSFAPLYLVAIPIGLWIMRKLPAQMPQSHKLEAVSFWVIVPVCMCLTYSGSLIGTVLSLLLSGGGAQNTVAEYAMDTNPLKVLVMVILAPLIEEYVCRRQIIDRTRQYGEKTAVFLSALIFGLLHQNLYQFFYAFALGLVFGYIYIRTGRLRYTILLHGIFNFMGSVLAPWVLSLLDAEALQNMDPTAPTEELMQQYQEILPELAIYVMYILILLGASIAGLILLITERKRLVWKESAEPLPQGTVIKTVYLNIGMVLFVLLCAIAVVFALVL